MHTADCRGGDWRYTGFRMTLLESDILNTLHELETGVAAMKTADPKPNLVPLFERLRELSGRLPHPSHARLVHYLDNGSYQKARLWLEGRDAENARGRCGG